MSRELTAAVQAALQADRVLPVFLYEGEFSTGTLRLWSGVGDLSWNGYTWTGAGRMLGMSAVRESQSLEAIKFNVALNGETQALLSINLSAVRQGMDGTVWLGVMSEPDAYVSLPGSSGNYISTPDSAAISVTGDIDVRIKLAADDWSPAAQDSIFGKVSSGGAGRAWRLDLTTSGELHFRWSIDAVSSEKNGTSTANLSALSGGAVKWVRATLDVDNGASGHDLKFWTSDDGETWTQLGTTVTGAGVTNIQDDTGDLMIGASFGGSTQPFAGKAYRAEVRNGIDGPVVASFDARKFQHKNDRTAQMETGETWTVNRSGSPAAHVVHVPSALIADPKIAFKGKLDVPDILDDAQQCTLSVSYESRAIDLDRARVRRYTDEDQKIGYSTDLGFGFVASLQDMQVVWGGQQAAASPVAAPQPAQPATDYDQHYWNAIG